MTSIQFVDENNPCGVTYDYQRNRTIARVCKNGLSCMLQNRIIGNETAEYLFCVDQRGLQGDTCSRYKPCAFNLPCLPNEYGVHTCGGTSYWKSHDHIFNKEIRISYLTNNKQHNIFIGIGLYFLATIYLLYLYIMKKRVNNINDEYGKIY